MNNVDKMSRRKIQRSNQMRLGGVLNEDHYDRIYLEKERILKRGYRGLKGLVLGSAIVFGLTIASALATGTVSQNYYLKSGLYCHGWTMNVEDKRNYDLSDKYGTAGLYLFGAACVTGFVWMMAESALRDVQEQRA